MTTEFTTRLATKTRPNATGSPGIGRRLTEISLAALATVLASAADAVEVDVYGRLNVTLQNSDEAAEEKVELQSIWRTSPQIDPLTNRLDSLLSLGLDRMLGEATKLFAFYTTGDIGGTSESNNYAAIGIEHKF